MAIIKLPPVPVHKNVHVYAYLSKKLDKQLRSAAKRNRVPISWAVAVAWAQFYAARVVREECYNKMAGPASRVRAHFYLPPELANQVHEEALNYAVSTGSALEAAWSHYVDAQRTTK